MKVAITGGTGFVGRHLAAELSATGSDVVLVARGRDRSDLRVTERPNVSWVAAGVGDADALREAFAGCDVVVHCAGINREIGAQTYAAVHVDGTRNVVDAARATGVAKGGTIRRYRVPAEIPCSNRCSDFSSNIGPLSFSRESSACRPALAPMWRSAWPASQSFLPS